MAKLPSHEDHYCRDCVGHCRAYACAGFAPLGPKDVATKFMKPPQDFFPLSAQEFGDHGKAGALCTVQADGSLSECATVDEAPKGKHFGEAVLKIAGVMRVGSIAKDGSKTAGRKFLLRVNF